MRLLACALLMACSGIAAAQLRGIPPDAKPGVMRHAGGMDVLIDGKPRRLSPGAQIRSPSNMIVLPVSVSTNTTVRYQTDASGAIHRAWILSPQEAAVVQKQWDEEARKRKAEEERKKAEAEKAAKGGKS